MLYSPELPQGSRPVRKKGAYFYGKRQHCPVSGGNHQILGKMQEGADSFEIEIEPANLGKIAVKIQYQDGQATVSIFCTEKRALEVLGDRAREIGVIIDKNLGGETKIIVEKQEPDYLNRNNDENQQGKQDEREQQKENHQKQDSEDSEQFLQKLRLGLTV